MRKVQEGPSFQDGASSFLRRCEIYGLVALAWKGISIEQVKLVRPQYLRPRVPAHISLLTTAAEFESVVLESLAFAIAVGFLLGV